MLGAGAGAVEDGAGCGLGALVVGFGAGVPLPVLMADGCRLVLWRGTEWWCLARLCVRWALGVADGVVLGLADGFETAVAAVEGAAWLKRFMKPTTPTALSRVARQVRVDTLRRPWSRRARSRSCCLMATTKPETTLRDHQGALKAASARTEFPDRGAAGSGQLAMARDARPERSA